MSLAVDRGAEAAQNINPDVKPGACIENVHLELAFRAGDLQQKRGLASAGLGVTATKNEHAFLRNVNLDVFLAVCS